MRNVAKQSSVVPESTDAFLLWLNLNWLDMHAGSRLRVGGWERMEWRVHAVLNTTKQATGDGAADGDRRRTSSTSIGLD